MSLKDARVVADAVIESQRLIVAELRRIAIALELAMMPMPTPPCPHPLAAREDLGGMGLSEEWICVVARGGCGHHHHGESVG